MKRKRVLQYVGGNWGDIYFCYTTTSTEYMFRQYWNLNILLPLFLPFNTFNTQFWSFNKMAKEERSRSTIYTFHVFRLDFVYYLQFQSYEHRYTTTRDVSCIWYSFHLSSKLMFNRFHLRSFIPLWKIILNIERS